MSTCISTSTFTTGSGSIASEKKRRANRRNARRSTGPRSAEGKAVSSRNATSHGIFCQDLVLPGESQEIFHALRQAFILQQRPQNLVELLIVDRMVAATWKLRRLQAAEALMHDGCMQDLLECRGEAAERVLEEFDGSDASAALAAEVEKMELPPAAVLAMKLQSPDQAFERLQRYEQRLDYTIHRCLRELRKLREDAELEAALPASPFLRSTGVPPVSGLSDAEEEAKENTGETPVLQRSESSAQNEATAAQPAITPVSAGSNGGVLANVAPTEQSPDRPDDFQSPPRTLDVGR